jgi:hypothetical protein
VKIVSVVSTSTILSRLWLLDGVWIGYWIYWSLIHATQNYKWYSSIADLHTLQFTVIHSLVSSVFTSRVLATDFNTVIIPVSHIKSPFLSRNLATTSQLSVLNHLRLPPQEIPSIIPLLPSYYPGRLASRVWVRDLCYDRRSVGQSILE